MPPGFYAAAALFFMLREGMARARRRKRRDAGRFVPAPTRAQMPLALRDIGCLMFARYSF